jgi:uncharacterized membrane protein HdeD (DUF308 family)
MSLNQQIDQGAAFKSVRDHWVLFLVEGIVLVLLGTLAILLPALASLAFTIFFGWLLLISGIVGLVTTLMARQAPGFWWSLLSAMLGIVAGVILLVWPISGTLSLTYLLIAFFLVEGFASIMYAVEHRSQLSGRWGWMLASGVVDVILAVIVFIGLPWSAFWALGLLLGINMIFGGWALIAMALHARSAGPTASSAGSPTPSAV